MTASVDGYDDSDLHDLALEQIAEAGSAGLPFDHSFSTTPQLLQSRTDDFDFDISLVLDLIGSDGEPIGKMSRFGCAFWA